MSNKFDSSVLDKVFDKLHAEDIRIFDYVKGYILKLNNADVTINDIGLADKIVLTKGPHMGAEFSIIYNEDKTYKEIHGPGYSKVLSKQDNGDIRLTIKENASTVIKTKSNKDEVESNTEYNYFEDVLYSSTTHKYFTNSDNTKVEYIDENGYSTSVETIITDTGSIEYTNINNKRYITTTVSNIGGEELTITENVDGDKGVVRKCKGMEQATIFNKGSIVSESVIFKDGDIRKDTLFYDIYQIPIAFIREYMNGESYFYTRPNFKPADGHYVKIKLDASRIEYLIDDNNPNKIYVLNLINEDESIYFSVNDAADGYLNMEHTIEYGNEISDLLYSYGDVSNMFSIPLYKLDIELNHNGVVKSISEVNGKFNNIYIYNSDIEGEYIGNDGESIFIHLNTISGNYTKDHMHDSDMSTKMRTTKINGVLSTTTESDSFISVDVSVDDEKVYSILNTYHNNTIVLNDILSELSYTVNDVSVHVDIIRDTETRMYEDGMVVSTVPWGINTDYIKYGMYNILVEYNIFGSVGNVNIKPDNIDYEMSIAFTPELGIDVMVVESEHMMLSYDSRNINNEIRYIEKDVK